MKNKSQSCLRIFSIIVSFLGCLQTQASGIVGFNTRGVLAGQAFFEVYTDGTITPTDISVSCLNPADNIYAEMDQVSKNQINVKVPSSSFSSCSFQVSKKPTVSGLPRCLDIKAEFARTGTRCETSAGAVFERVQPLNFWTGVYWQDPVGRIWSNKIATNLEQTHASEQCPMRVQRWSRLPEQAEFEFAARAGMDEVIGDFAKGGAGFQTEVYWTSQLGRVVLVDRPNPEQPIRVRSQTKTKTEGATVMCIVDGQTRH